MRVMVTETTVVRNFKEIDRISYDELMRRFEKNESVVGTIKITLWDFRGYPETDYVLVNALVDLDGRGIHGISVLKYEVLCSNGEDIFLNVTLTKAT